MSEDKSKLQLIGEIAQANNKNLELIEELNDREDEIERLKEINKELGRDYSSANNGYLRLHSIIKEVREYIKEHQCCDGKINVMTKTEFERLLEILDKEGK